MKRFKFKLENVLNYRVTLEGLAKNAYQEALRVLNIEKEALHKLQTVKQALTQSYNIQAGAVVSPETLTLLSRYAVQLSHLIEKQTQVVADKQAIATEKFQEWNRKRMDVKVIERLKEKKWHEYLSEMDKEDQKFQDEIFIAKTIRETRERQ
ncbi:MAG: flagellar export protein FliJ [Candidatus Omnitrophota bacterium]